MVESVNNWHLHGVIILWTSAGKIAISSDGILPLILQEANR